MYLGTSGDPRNGACGRSHLRGCGRVSCVGDGPEGAGRGALAASHCTWLVRGGGEAPAGETTVCWNLQVGPAHFSAFGCLCVCVSGGRQAQ